MAEAEVIDVIERMLTSIALREPGVLREVLPTVLPWTRVLPATDLDLMAAEIIAVVAIGDTTRVSQLLTEWRHTAEFHADPDLYQALTSQRLADFGPVP